MIFHIPSLAHLVCNKTSVSCAYTQKVYKLCRMLTEAGHTVYHYGVEGSDPVCTENVDVADDAWRRRTFPDNDDRTKQFSYDVKTPYEKAFAHRAAAEILKRRQRSGEFLLCAWGFGHKPVADILGAEVVPVESGIGYADTWAPFRVFESTAWQHYCYGLGRCNPGGPRTPDTNGSWYDTVIPNFFDPDDFEYREEKSGYLLYLGRLVKRKGVELAAEVALEAGERLVVAGQGLPTDEGMELKGDVEFVGYADVKKRRDLLAGAKALLCPTYYIEPFGGVAVEAAFSGTPVICTDWGGFTENVAQGLTGFRCRSFSEFVAAVKALRVISPEQCRRWAMHNYSCEVITPRYVEYFEFVLRHGAVLPGADWYARA